MLDAIDRIQEELITRFRTGAGLDEVVGSALQP